MTGKDMLKGIQNMDADLIEEAEFGTFGKKQTRFSKRTKLLLVLAAALIMGTMTAAAVFTRWSTTAQTRYNPTQEIKEQAQKSGLSVMLEETKGTENPNEVLSATDQGITITAVQSLVDNYGAEITFRVEGVDLPEGQYPTAWPKVTIDGDLFFFRGKSGGFFDGTTRNEEGQWVYASMGEPVRFRDDALQSAILDWAADDGSMEYTYYISFLETDGRYMDKKIVFQFHSIDFESEQKGGASEPSIEGNWELRWTLTGTSDSITVTPNAKIGDSDVVLLDAEIGQLSLRTRYQVKEYWEGWDELVVLPQGVCGVRMKDGSEYWCVESSFGFEDREKMIYFIESTMYDGILDISQVESLIFPKGWGLDAWGRPTIETYCYIPVSVE